ncbi:nitrogen regulation protein NR(II) [Paenibacillus shenyangensis]|uniref:PAS domain-containing protein n=1 Tax=Paenibacillus sp. A9 TaxID=1284352 RepID=UPI000367B55A|nr:PAS domain-containing protein [Paenibacillus sp. A9]
MNKRLDQVFCGYMSLSSGHLITAANETLLELLGYNQNGLYGCHFESILTRASRIFYQMYFIPRIRLNTNIEALQLAIKSGDGTEVPFLINARIREREGAAVYELILLPMHQQIQHEEQIRILNQEAKRLQQELDMLRNSAEDSAAGQQELARQIDLQEQKIELMESYASKSKPGESLLTGSQQIE